ncbi:hypothetical protein KAX14_03455 [Candidatus Bipolaricaulota bacterium]|nr:hypothetical protein [Candidatus Bipolaricaulota bacterium]
MNNETNAPGCIWIDHGDYACVVVRGVRVASCRLPLQRRMLRGTGILRGAGPLVLSRRVVLSRVLLSVLRVLRPVWTSLVVRCSQYTS